MSLNSMELLGRGRTAEVYRHKEGRALKLFFGDIAAEVVHREAAKARIIGPLCSAAPAFYGATQIDGRLGLIYECINGKPLIDVQSLLDQPFDPFDPFELTASARAMAHLQLAIHATPADGLPGMADAFQASIAHYPHLSAAGRQRLLHFIQQNDTAQLCHGDLHVENVLRQNDHSLRAIDWTNAYSGHPLCDLARTIYMILHGLIPGTERIEDAELPLRNAFAAAYRQTYYDATKLDRKDEDIWHLLALLGRYGEKITGEAAHIEMCITEILRTRGDLA